jgi:hypothetical protein
MKDKIFSDGLALFRLNDPTLSFSPLGKGNILYLSVSVVSYEEIVSRIAPGI